jgi:hypothetical protein
MEYGLVIGFIDHFNIPLGTASTYNAITDFHTSQITTAPAKPFPPCCIFASHSLATVPNSGDSSASRSQALLSQPLVQNFFNCQLNYSAISSQPPLQSSTEVVAPILIFITPRGVTRRQQPVSPVACVTACRCPEPFTEPLPRNGSDITAHFAIVT